MTVRFIDCVNDYDSHFKHNGKTIFDLTLSSFDVCSNMVESVFKGEPICISDTIDMTMNAMTVSDQDITINPNGKNF